MLPTNYLLLLSTILSLPQSSSQLPFKGMTYSPYLPGQCGNLEKVKSDLKILSKYTPEIRLYGADCDQVEFVLSAISSQSLNMKVMLGIWTRGEASRFQKELEAVQKALSNPKYAPLISRVSVGNEDIDNKIPASKLKEDIDAVKKALKSYKVSIGTVDIGEVFKKTEMKSIIEACDFIGVNIHPYFNKFLKATVNITEAVPPINTYMNELASFIPSSKMLISEIGFPTKGDPSKDYGPPSAQAQFDFLKGVNCKVTQWQYFAFEAFDSDFKNDNSFGGVEKNFGILTKQGELKVGKIDNFLKC